MRFGTRVVVCLWTVGALSAIGQTNGNDTAERSALASLIANARETAGGREWDAGFRASFVTRLSALEVGVLRQLAQQGETADLGPYIGYSVRPASNQDAASNQAVAASQATTLAAMLGDSTQDLVFTPIAPCRVINSVAAPGPIVVPPGGSTTKTYIIRGGIALNPSFAAQGGIPCDVPTSAAAVSVNFTVAGPSQPGHVIVDPSHLAGGLTSTLNFSPAPAGLNLANGVITPLCDFSVSACATDIKVTVAFGTTHFLADITGYFAPPTGSISVASGGTGQATLTTNAIIYGQGTSAVGTAVGAAGQVLAGAAGPPVWTGSPSLSGTLTLVNPSTSTAGNIFKGANRFIHNFGTNNTFVGEYAGNFTMTGSANVGVGIFALQNNTLGYSDTAIGQNALGSNTTGNNNTATGLNALLLNTVAADNTATGVSALQGNSTAQNNTAVGSGALQSQSFSNAGSPWNSENTAVGYQALFTNQPTSISSGIQNTAVGSQALRFNTTGYNNTASGFQALYGNTTGTVNTASGVYALTNNTTANKNTAVGSNALATQSFSNANIAWDSDNTAVGFNALNLNQPTSTVSGIRDTALGSQALRFNTTGASNTASGFQALYGTNGGSANTASGSQALYSNTTGNNNTAAGFQALASNMTGGGNTAIGYGADVASGALTNATAIGNTAVVNASNKIRLGNASVTVIEGQVAYTFPSDRNKKENFRDVDAQQVLQKLRGMSVTSWNYIGHDAKQFRHYGPMAQDFFAAFGHDELGVIGSETTINSGDITGILMLGLKGLDMQVQQDQRTITAQAGLLNQQAARIAELERQAARVAGLLQRLESVELASR